MPYYKFGANDIFYNTIEAHPKCKFLIHNGKTYYNEQIPEPSDYTKNSNDANVNHVKTGEISLYEMNVNRKEATSFEQSNRYMEFDDGSGSNPGGWIDLQPIYNENGDRGPFDFTTTGSNGNYSISGWVKTTEDLYYNQGSMILGFDPGKYIRMGDYGDQDKKNKLTAMLPNFVGTSTNNPGNFEEQKGGQESNADVNLTFTVPVGTTSIDMTIKMWGDFSRGDEYSATTIGGIFFDDLSSGVDGRTLVTVVDNQTLHHTYWAAGSTLSINFNPSSAVSFSPERFAYHPPHYWHYYEVTLNYKLPKSTAKLYSSKDINDGEWHHFLVSVENDLTTTTGRLYMDGVLDREVDIGGYVSVPTPYNPDDTFRANKNWPPRAGGIEEKGWMRIGNYVGGSDWYSLYEGPSLGARWGRHDSANIADIAIWDAPLTANAVRDIYNNGIPRNLKQTFRNYTFKDNLKGWWTMGDTVVDPDFWLKFDAADGSTTITDSSRNSITCTSSGAGAEIDTAEYKYRSSSLLLNGTEYITIDNTANSGAFNWDGAFTIDFWMMLNNANTHKILYPKADYVTANNTAPLSLSWRGVNTNVSGSPVANTTYTNTFWLKIGNDSADQYFFKVDSDGTTPLNTTDWHHVEVVRDLDNNIKVFFNKNQLKRSDSGGGDLTGDDLDQIPNVTRTFDPGPAGYLIGRVSEVGNDGSSLTAYDSFHGHIDEFKISETDRKTSSMFPLILDQSGNGTHGYVKNITPNNIYPEAISSITEASEMIQPFINKDSTALSFKSVSKVDYQSFEFGSMMTGKYPLSAGITIEKFGTFHGEIDEVDGYDRKTIMQNRSHIVALQNTLNNYTTLSPYYSTDPKISPDGVNKLTAAITLISIPSIFYGSSIEKGSVNLQHYVSGSLIGELQDSKQNGELIQTTSLSEASLGKVAGLVLYNEGFIMLFDSSDSDSHWMDSWESSFLCSDGSHLTEDACLCGSVGEWDSTDGSCTAGSATGNTWDSDTTVSNSISFNGTNRIPTLTMLAHAKKGELNHSNNPTYLTHGQKHVNIESNKGTVYAEKTDLEIANTAKSPHKDAKASFQKQTWISKIGIYDENNNLIAIAKLANPVRKTEDRDFTFKLKLDF